MFAPYLRSAHHIDEKSFRQRLSETCGQKAAGAAGEPLRHVTMVGVNRPHVFGFDGMDEDSIRIRAMLDYLDRSGVAIAPDFVIDPVDFMMGRDFLREDTPTDLVFVSCILKTSRKSIDGDAHLARIGDAARRDPSLAFDLSTRLSDRQSTAAWQARIAQSGAKLCVTFGGTDEVDTAYAAAPGYRVILPTPQREIPLWTDRHESAAAFYGYAGSDMPMLWLGLTAKDDWMAARKADRPAQTHLESLLRPQRPAPLFPAPDISPSRPFGRCGLSPKG